MYPYEVLFLDSDGSQRSGGVFPRFSDAQGRRDELLSQGYESWIEEVVPAYSGVSP